MIVWIWVHLHNLVVNGIDMSDVGRTRNGIPVGCGFDLSCTRPCSWKGDEPEPISCAVCFEANFLLGMISNWNKPTESWFKDYKFVATCFWLTATSSPNFIKRERVWSQRRWFRSKKRIHTCAAHVDHWWLAWDCSRAIAFLIKCTSNEAECNTKTHNEPEYPWHMQHTRMVQKKSERLKERTARANVCSTHSFKYHIETDAPNDVGNAASQWVHAPIHRQRASQLTHMYWCSCARSLLLVVAVSDQAASIASFQPTFLFSHWWSDIHTQ